ncbi:MAG: hypothetical protein N3I35_17020 [Clostridia bacterium]|nr:hypothetical protein [Clostridia bacterium]
MDIGLYNAKYPFRKFISGILRYTKNISPNTISVSMLPVGVFTGLCYYYADEYPGLLMLGAILIFVRMILGTLDGLVAVTYNKCSPEGEIVNRITPELCDVILIVAIVLKQNDSSGLGFWVLAMAWITSFAGLVGLTGKKPIQSVGPVGQTDRITVLMFLSVFGFIAYLLGYSLPVLRWFIWWCIGGGIITITIRFYRNLSVSKNDKNISNSAKKNM